MRGGCSGQQGESFKKMSALFTAEVCLGEEVDFNEQPIRRNFHPF